MVCWARSSVRNYRSSAQVAGPERVQIAVLFLQFLADFCVMVCGCLSLKAFSRPPGDTTPERGQMLAVRL